MTLWGGGITGSVDLCIVEMMWSHKPIDKRIYNVDIKGILLKHERSSVSKMRIIIKKILSKNSIKSVSYIKPPSE